jgi:hypothetical protein
LAEGRFYTYALALFHGGASSLHDGLLGGGHVLPVDL